LLTGEQSSNQNTPHTASSYNAMTTKHSMPLTQHGQHHRQLSMMQASYPALTGTWLQWTATPDVLGCTTKRLARTERQFQHEQALCATFEPLLHGSSISPQTDTCIKRNRPLVATQSRGNTVTCLTKHMHDTHIHKHLENSSSEHKNSLIPRLQLECSFLSKNL